MDTPVLIKCVDCEELMNKSSIIYADLKYSEKWDYFVNEKNNHANILDSYFLSELNEKFIGIRSNCIYENYIKEIFGNFCDYEIKYEPNGLVIMGAVGKKIYLIDATEEKTIFDSLYKTIKKPEILIPLILL